MHNFLFLNDTEGDYHFGCSCTSRLIRERLLEHGHCDSFGVLEVWSTDIPPVSEWDHADAFRKWETEHAELSNKLHKCDTIVANGEGTILLWEGRKGTQALLFLLYAAKIHLGKRCVLINHSSFPFLSLYTLSKRIATPPPPPRSDCLPKSLLRFGFLRRARHALSRHPEFSGMQECPTGV